VKDINVKLEIRSCVVELKYALKRIIDSGSCPASAVEIAKEAIERLVRLSGVK
jgi:hypothetical protein